MAERSLNALSRSYIVKTQSTGYELRGKSGIQERTAFVTRIIGSDGGGIGHTCAGPRTISTLSGDSRLFFLRRRREDVLLLLGHGIRLGGDGVRGQPDIIKRPRRRRQYPFVGRLGYEPLQ